MAHPIRTNRKKSGAIESARVDLGGSQLPAVYFHKFSMFRAKKTHFQHLELQKNQPFRSFAEVSRRKAPPLRPPKPVQTMSYHTSEKSLFYSESNYAVPTPVQKCQRSGDPEFLSCRNQNQKDHSREEACTERHAETQNRA